MKTISLDGITYNLISEKEVATSDVYTNSGDDCSDLNVVKEYLVKKIRGTHKYKIEEKRNRLGGTYFSDLQRVWC